MSYEADLRMTAQRFVAAAFEALRKEHVIPTPVHHPYVSVGRDYFGDTIRAVDGYSALEQQLDEAYPERFGGPLGPHAEFSTTYIFSFLEACIVRCAPTREFQANAPAVDESITELLAILGSATNEIVCCRHVSHLTTTGGDELEIGDVTVVPEPEGQLTARIHREIPGTPAAWNREDPRPYAPPHSLLIVREISEDSEPHAIARRLSGRLERFLLIARLLTAGTVQSIYEVSGGSTLVARMSPMMMMFRARLFGGLVRRTVRLRGDEQAAFEALGRLIDSAEVKREAMIATSFDIAVSKFNRSNTDGTPYEHLVDLATALEAVLIGM